MSDITKTKKEISEEEKRLKKEIKEEEKRLKKEEMKRPEIEYDDEKDDETGLSYTKMLENEKQHLQKEITFIHNGYDKKYLGPCIFILVGVLLLIISVLPIRMIFENNKNVFYIAVAVSLGLFAFGSLRIVYKSIFNGVLLVKNPTFTMLKERLKTINEELGFIYLTKKVDTINEKEKNDEIIKNYIYQKKAEVLFLNNQKNLKRYYDINIQHLKGLLPLGILSILLGVGIIIITMVLFRKDGDIQILPLIIGAVSSLVVDSVGALFIFMYNNIINNSLKFHNSLTETNDVFLAHVLAAKINDTTKRDKILSEMVKILSTPKPKTETKKKE